MTTTTVRGAALAVLLLGPALLAGCGSDEPRVERLAFCQGHSGDDPADGMLDVEFRQGSAVVAQGSVNVGFVFSAVVPLGGVRVYVDGRYAGSMNEGLPEDSLPPASTENASVYMSGGEGCPESPLL